MEITATDTAFVPEVTAPTAMFTNVSRPPDTLGGLTL